MQAVCAGLNEKIPLRFLRSNPRPDIGTLGGLTSEIQSEEWHTKRPDWPGMKLKCVFVAKDAAQRNLSDDLTILDHLETRGETCASAYREEFLPLNVCDDELRLPKKIDRRISRPFWPSFIPPANDAWFSNNHTWRIKFDVDLECVVGTAF